MPFTPRAVVARMVLVAGIRRAGSSEGQHGALQQYQNHQEQQSALRQTHTEASLSVRTCPRSHVAEQK